MDKKVITEFFDSRAHNWDSNCEHNKDVIGRIVRDAEIGKDMTVLDVGCGTGIMIPFYLEQDVSGITGLDIAENMLKVAAGKYPDQRVSFVCADAETVSFENLFDRCVIYNAFPHFPNPYALIKNLASCVKPGGILTIAHGSSREHIDSHHMQHAGTVSIRLLSDDEFVELLTPYFEITVLVSDDSMLQIVGVRKQLS